MTNLVAKILLSLLMLPLTAMLYGGMMILVYSLLGRSDNVPSFLIGGGITWIFVATYWVLLWRKSVSWTPMRRMLTLGAGVIVLFPAVIIGTLITPMTEITFGIFVGTGVTILLWLTATILIWRETKTERIERLRQRGVELVLCPSCGYNLTGLRSTQCPECGQVFTVDHLLAAQKEAKHESLEP